MSKSDAEEGELSENSDTEIQPYVALERPILQATKSFTQQRTVLQSSYNDYSSESETSSSDEDLPSFKRRKLRTGSTTVIGPPPPATTRKNVWSSVLLEENLEEEIKDFGVVSSIKHIDQPRSAETYNYKPAERVQSDDESGQENEAREVLKRLDKKDGSRSLIQEHQKPKEENYEQSLEETKKLLQKRKRKMADRHTNRKQHLKPKFTRVENLDVSKDASDIDLAQDIAAKLYENKFDLILRTIQILGKENAIRLFEETRDIENDGGILTSDGSRRRTPGGVYLHLLRNHEEIPMEKIREVFREENRVKEQIRRAFRAKRRQDKAQSAVQQESGGLPDLPSRAELMLTEEQRTRTEPDADIFEF